MYKIWVKRDLLKIAVKGYLKKINHVLKIVLKDLKRNLLNEDLRVDEVVANYNRVVDICMVEIIIKINIKVDEDTKYPSYIK